MLHKLRKKIRHYWHNIYFAITADKGADFAMTCKEVTEEIDLPSSDSNSLQKARVKLHVSLCQACHNYYSFSQILKKLTRKFFISQKLDEKKIEQLNRKLLNKYQKKGSTGIEP